MQHVSEALIAVLQDQIACAQAMLDALGREHDALRTGNAEELAAAGAAKAELVEALEQLERQRRSLTDTIATGTPDDTLRPAEWRKLLEMITACKQQNERNGALVRARSEQVRVALRTLRGAEPDLYGRAGLTPATADPRSLGTA